VIQATQETDMARLVGSVFLTGSISVAVYSERNGYVYFPTCLRHGIEAVPVRSLDLVTGCPVCVAAGDVRPVHAPTIRPAAA
jgi:hypothetical protein